MGGREDRTLGDDIGEELHGHTAGSLATDGDIEENARIGHLMR